MLCWKSEKPEAGSPTKRLIPHPSQWFVSVGVEYVEPSSHAKRVLGREVGPVGPFACLSLSLWRVESTFDDSSEDENSLSPEDTFGYNKQLFPGGSVASKMWTFLQIRWMVDGWIAWRRDRVYSQLREEWQWRKRIMLNRFM